MLSGQSVIREAAMCRSTLFLDHANPSVAILRLPALDKVHEEEAEAQVLGLKLHTGTNTGGRKG